MRTYNTIEGLKKLAGDIPEPTCYLIDKAIKELRFSSKDCKTIEKLVKHADYDSAERELKECEDLADSIQRSLDETEIYLEDLRVANEQLRYLGEFWYYESKNYFNILEEYRDSFGYKIEVLLDRIRKFFIRKTLRNSKIKTIVKLVTVFNK